MEFCVKNLICFSEKYGVVMDETTKQHTGRCALCFKTDCGAYRVETNDLLIKITCY